MTNIADNSLEEKDNGAEDQIVRQILCSVDENASVSQRQLSREMGIALGSVNWYLKRCISKGLIKIQQVPLKRYMYYLTPQGFDEKGRLTAQYLKWSLDFFRQGREQSTELLNHCARKGWHHIVLAGDSDLAEIFILSGMESPIIIDAIVDEKSENGRRLRIPVAKNLKEAQGLAKPEQLNAVILTDLNAPKQTYESLIDQGFQADHILVPQALNFIPQRQEK